MYPIKFIAIGCGQVFTKYWLPAFSKGDVSISGVIGLEECDPLVELDNVARPPFYITTSTDNTIKILSDGIQNYDAIALLVPADVRLPLLKAILSEEKLKKKKIFLEKPFSREIDLLSEYKLLISKYSKRLHLAGKYAFGRADILINQLLKPDDLPLFINTVMIEGTRYFEKACSNSDNLYIKDGPELDIGYHMLNIVGVYLNSRKDKISEIIVDSDSVMDLNHLRPYFLPKYGFTAEVIFKLNSGVKIPMYLQVGKADCVNDRHIDFDFHCKRYTQEFATQSAWDPVYLIKEDTRILLDQHSKDYFYYSRELLPENFCKQKIEEQLLSIELNKVCLQIKHIRESKTQVSG